MRKVALALLVALVPTLALAANLTAITVTRGVPTGGTGTVSTLDNLIGTAGSPTMSVQTVQGISSMTPFLTTTTLNAETTKVIGTVNQGTSPWVISGAVTGTFWQATQPVSGTFYQATQPVSLATAPTTPVTGTFWQATQPVSGTFWQTTQPISGTVTATGSTSNASSGVATGSASIPNISYNYGFNGTTWDQLQVDASKYLKINCVTGCAGGSGGTSAVDAAAFTWGTTNFTPMGGFYQTTATSNPLTTGHSGAWQMTAQRAGFINVRNASGTELGTSSNPFVIDTPASGNLYGAVTSGAGATGSAVPTSGVYVAANKSGNLAGLTVDSSGYLQVNVAAGGG